MNRDVLLKKCRDYLNLETNDYFKNELQKVIDSNNMEDLNDRFYTDLNFGTGGLRGVIGGGYNRMNPFIVRRTSQGLSNYIKKTSKENASVVIAFDSRNFSDLFAEEAALVFCGNGINTFLFSSLRPTPELSFALRELKATAGIVITASHNPAEYNGYKVYWSDGGQIVPPHDSGIIEEVRKVSDKIKSISLSDAKRKNLLRFIDEKIDTKYIEMIKKYTIRPDLIKTRGKDLKIVYTPLHGAGKMLVERTFSEMGIKVITVPEQREPDGNFPTVKFPNPEEASAMTKALELGKKVDADIIMGTDPDVDRIGIAVPEQKGYRLITGNQLGALLCDYIFSSREKAGTLPKKPVFVKTIVTTQLQRLIAESYGAIVYDVLTGFKYIAEKIQTIESTDEDYVFGGEESCGFLVETEVRDKDAVSAALLAAEMALYNLSKGKTVMDYLNELYRKHGYFEELLISKYFKGESGIETIKNIMSTFRENYPKNLGKLKIVIIKDYLKGISLNLNNNTKVKINLHSSNVLQFILEDDSIFTMRPSGTEPKIKFYASCRSAPQMNLNEAEIAVGKKIEMIKKEIDMIT